MALLGDSYVRIILERRGYGFIAALLAVLFGIFYYILSSSNFDSFSNTLRYFISGLSTLLAVVVSFNTLALRNQLNNMPGSLEVLDKQLDRLASVLKPIIKQQEKDEQQESSASYKKTATLYYTDAMKSMLLETKHFAESIVKNNDISKMQETSKGQEKSFRNICTELISEVEKRVSLYDKYRSPYYLVITSTTGYVERIKFNQITYSNEQAKEIFDVLKRLHILRNISVRIYIRNSLTKLSYEMLMSTIPIITFAAIIASISNYEQYNTFLLRLLFAASSSIVIMPFLQLFVRTMPILAVVHSSSSIPFEQKE